MPEERHVVFGTGPVGLAVIEELKARGKTIRVVKRSGQASIEGVEVVRGDATNPEDTRAVCKDATHVYALVNAPDYHKWPEQFPPLQEGILEGAAASGAKLIVMENLYMYGPHGGKPMTEDLPLNGVGSRSTTRRQMTQALFAAHQSGKVRAVSGRASDFFGPTVRESVSGDRLFRAALEGKPAQALFSIEQPHTFTYIRDIGKALVILGERDEALGQAWHIPSPRTVTFREFIEMVFAEAGQPMKTQVLPGFMVPVIGLFMPPLRGESENKYMFTEPYVLDHSKFANAFGDIATPLEDAIKATVQWYRDN